MAKYLTNRNAAIAASGAVNGMGVYAVISTVTGEACTPAGLGISAGVGAAENLLMHNVVMPKVHHEAEKYRRKKEEKRQAEAAAATAALNNNPAQPAAPAATA